MFRKIRDLFTGSKPPPTSLACDKAGLESSRDLRVAAIVILIEMASADSAIDPSEVQTMCALVASEFKIAESELPDLVQSAISARQAKGKIDEFVALINERFDEQQRTSFLALIWRLVLADGQIDKSEQRFAVQMQYRLKLTDEQTQAARTLAEQGGM